MTHHVLYYFFCIYQVISEHIVLAESESWAILLSIKQFVTWALELYVCGISVVLLYSIIAVRFALQIFDLISGLFEIDITKILKFIPNRLDPKNLLWRISFEKNPCFHILKIQNSMSFKWFIFEGKITDVFFCDIMQFTFWFGK